MNTLHDITIGDKTQYAAYHVINIILSEICFTIYKAYMQSERRTRQVDMSSILLDGLLILEKHYKTSETKHHLLSKFIVIKKN